MTQFELSEAVKNTLTGMLILGLLGGGVYAWGLFVNMFVTDKVWFNVIYFLPFALYLTNVMGGLHRSLRKK